MERILEFLQETNGGFSSTRLAFLAATFTIISIWAASSIINKQMADIPDGVYIFWGALLTSKVAQRHIENKTPQ